MELLGELTHEVVLPCGILNQQGTEVDRRVTLREMSGALKALIGKKEYREDGNKTIDTILAHCVARLGDNPNPTGKAIGRLLNPDRDYLAYCVRKFSSDTGSVLPINLFCGKCQEPREVNLDVGVLPCYGLPDPTDVDERETTVRVLPPTGAKGWAQYAYVIKDETMGLEALLRYSNGDDLRAAMEGDPTNQEQIQQNLLADTIFTLKVQGREILGPIPRETFGKFPGRIIETLQNGMFANQPGIDLSVRIKCPKCATESPWRLAATDFFTSPLERKKSGTLKRLSGKPA